MYQLPFYGTQNGQMGPAPPEQFGGMVPIPGMNVSPQGAQPWGTPPPGAMAGGGFTPQDAGNGRHPITGLTVQQQQQLAQQSPGNPYMPQGGTGYGYGMGPGQSNLGYYQQDTPVGSFAGVDRVSRPWQQTAQQQTSQQQSANPYQMAGVVSINPNAGSNPYLGGQASQSQSVNANPYSGSNPYLQSTIDATISDATKGFNNTVMPRFDSMANASGSFGNTGVEQMRGQAMSSFGQNLGNTIGGMRFGDYTRQQDLAESALNREQSNRQFNSNLSAGDLNRNTGAYFTGAGLDQQGRMFDTSNALGTQQFNASAGNTNSMFNAGQGNAMNMFNAGQGNQIGTFNAGQGNAMSQYMAGLDQNVNLTNAGAANNMLGQVRGLNEQGRQFDQTLGEGQRRYNNDFDYSAARNAIFDPMQIQSWLYGMNNQGLNTAGMEQNTPLNYLSQFFGLGNATGGLGGTSTGTNSQNMQGNPLMGGVGGAMAFYQLMNQIYGGG